VTSMQDQNPIKWLIKFFLLLAFFYWLHETTWIQAHVLDPFATASAWLADKVLNFIGFEVQRRGASIQTASGSFEIAGSCTGTLVVFLYAGAVLSFPASIKSKAVGLLSGFVFLNLLNFVRTLAIILFSSKIPSFFWAMHVVVGQAVVIAGTLAVFMWWVQHEGRPTFLSSGKRGWLKTVGFFLVGFLGGYGLYFLFLGSPFGAWSMKLIVAHSAWVLHFFTETSYKDAVIQTATCSINVNPKCLSSPIVVLLAGGVFALPMKWWKKLLIILIGFWPFYYAYHVGRTFTTALSVSGGTSVVHSIFFSSFGQLVLILFCFLMVGYHDHRRSGKKGFARFLLIFIAASALCIPVAYGLGEFYKTFFLPWLTQWINDSPRLYFDGMESLSRMLEFQAFIWVALMCITPGLALRQRIVRGIVGLGGVFLNCFLTVGFIELFHLKPDVMPLQFWIVIVPFGMYYVMRWKEFR